MTSAASCAERSRTWELNSRCRPSASLMNSWQVRRNTHFAATTPSPQAGPVGGDGQPHRRVLVLLQRLHQERQRLEHRLGLLVHRQRVLADAARLQPLACGVEQGPGVDVPSEQLHPAFTIASISSR